MVGCWSKTLEGTGRPCVCPSSGTGSRMDCMEQAAGVLPGHSPVLGPQAIGIMVEAGIQLVLQEKTDGFSRQQALEELHEVAEIGKVKGIPPSANRCSTQVPCLVLRKTWKEGEEM